MTNRLLAAGVTLIALATGSPAALADDALAKALEKVTKEQLAAFNEEDVSATLGYAYSKSPTYDEASEALTSLFAEADAKAELVSFQYIGHDDEFALARVKVKVTSEDEGFLDNVVDTFAIFHQEAGAWKLWDTYLLGGVLVP